MKKLLVMTLVLAMSGSLLAACGSSEEPEATTETEETTEAVDASPEWTEFDKLIEEIKLSTDLVDREAKMHQAEDMLMETGALLPLYYYNDVYMMKPEVSNVFSSNYGHKFFQYAEAPSTTLRINLSSEPAKLDPVLNSSVDGSTLAKMAFSGLYTYDADGNVIPDLAEGYEVSEDGLTYVFTLKDGLMWSDGSELNAKDFEYSWKRAANPQTASDYAYMFDIIKTNDAGELDVVASEDGKTFTVNLKAPCAYFLDLAAFTTFLPVQQTSVEAAEGWETNPGAWAQEAGFVSNGPFVLTEWNHDSSMVYEKNPNWHDAANVKIERIELMLSADDTAIFAAYNAGDLDFIDTIPTDEIASLLDNDEFYIVDQLGTYYAVFNVNSPIFDGKTPEQASAMRRAISLLIDREYIVDAVAQAGQQPATSFIPANMLDGQGNEFKQNDDAYTYPVEESAGYVAEAYSEDAVEEAIALLTEAGYEFDEDGTLSDATPITLAYLANEGSGHVAIAEAMQQDLAEVGIDMTIDSVEWNVFLEERKQGNFDFARNGWIADFNDPINMLEMWTTDSGNNDAQFGR